MQREGFAPTKQENKYEFETNFVGKKETIFNRQKGLSSDEANLE